MKQVKLTLMKSLIGRKKDHLGSIKGLGLRRIRQSVVVNCTPENLGMINQVSYLLLVEEV